MANTSTPMLFVGGVEGAAGQNSVATSPINGVGTTLVPGTTPVLAGGLNLVNGQTGQTAVALPPVWPLGSPLTVANAGAVAALVFPNAATHQINGASAGTSYSVAAGKAATFFYVGLSATAVPQWIAVGA